MKLSNQLVLALFAFLLSASQAAALPGRAEVVKVTGNATTTDAKGNTKSIAAGMALGTGDSITTGAGSTVDLNLGINGDYLRVDPDTTLKIDALDIANVAQRTVTTQLNVNRGAITGNVVNKLSLASKYEIKSASGVAGIRGTKYSVKVANGRITRLVVTSGVVSFTQGGVTITIDATNGPKAYSPPATGPADQSAVGNPTPEETSAVNSAAASIGTSGTSEAGGVTVSVNPLNVSVSQ